MGAVHGGSPENDQTPRYPHTPGHRGVDTSMEAAEAMQPHVGRIQRMVLAAVTDAGEKGLTSEECCGVLGLDRWTVQPRTTELKLKGFIRPSGEKRFNSTGKRARVWVAVPASEQAARNGSQAEETRLTNPSSSQAA